MKSLVQGWMLSLLLAGAACPSGAPPAADFYVSPHGDDGNPGTRDKPFATLTRVRDALRGEIAKGLSRNLTVFLRGGTYRITEPVVLGPGDSGTDEFSITYAAPPGEEPVISGGRVISGWRAGAAGTWSATVDEVQAGRWRFRELFINGRRAQRARHPNHGYLRLVRSGPDRRTGFEFQPGDIKNYSDIRDVEVVYLHDWSISRVRAREVDEKKHTITLDQPIGAGSGFWQICGFEPHPRYFLENSREFLDAPGEWHLDVRTGVLTYRPLPGEEIGNLEAIAPVAEQLLVVRGDETGRPVKNLRFRGLTFEHCAFHLPAGGYAGIQAAYHQNRSRGSPGRGILSPAVLFEVTRSCRFEECTIRNVGCSGLGFGSRCNKNILQGSCISGVAANGVMIGEDRSRQVKGTPWWQSAPEEVAAENLLKNNLVEHCGQEFYGAVGIWVGIAAETTISHNEIRHHPYTGVSVGWMWNPTPTPCRGNLLENNHIHHVMQILSDGGGIYTLGLQPGTVIRGNIIHDVPLNLGRAESNGMFLDEGTTDMVIEENVIYNVDRSPLRFHRATENLVRNNILVVQKDVPPVRYNATDPGNIKMENNKIRRVGLEKPFRRKLLGER